MKFKSLFVAAFAALAVSASAQTHKEGVEYYKADQFENAKELLNRNFNNSGTDKAIANYYLGQIALGENKNDEAKKYFDAGVQANPQYAYNYIGLGALALRNGDSKAASDYFKQGEKLLEKKDAAGQIAIARAYYDADPVAYAKEIEKRDANARKKNMKDPSIYMFEGDQEWDNKNWGKASGMYDMAKNFDPSTTEAYVKSAKALSQVNPKQGVVILKELLSVNPTSALGQRELANTYYDMGDFKNAAAEYGKYVQNPNHFKQDEDRYAFLLFYSQDFQKGYDYASKLLAANPGNFTARRYQFMNAANIQALADKLVPMAEELLAAHNANPSVNKFAPIDFTLIADELTKANRTDEALAVLQEATKEMPDNANFNKQIAMTYANNSDMASAAKAFETYVAKIEKPTYNDFIQQAMFYYAAGVTNKSTDPVAAENYFKDAEKYIDKAQAELPDNYKPKKVLGDIAIQRAATDEEVKSAAFPMYSEAAALLEKASDTSRYTTDAKNIYNYLGNYYLDHKDVAKAKECFNKYLQYDPNNEDYRKFVDSLKTE